MRVAVLALVGLLLVSGCAGTAEPQEKERGAVEFDPFRSSRTTDFVSSTDLLTTVKSAPTRVVVPSLGLDMRIDTEGLEPNGDMSLPVSPFRAGWYEYAAAPNSPAGATVLAAHVDALGEGLGPFSRLRSLDPGADASVIDAAGTTHNYRVVSVERIDKGVVPWANYFSLAGAPRLVLITCGGEYDSSVGSYDDNYIVTAEKVS